MVPFFPQHRQAGAEAVSVSVLVIHALLLSSPSPQIMVSSSNVCIVKFLLLVRSRGKKIVLFFLEIVSGICTAG